MKILSSSKVIYKRTNWRTGYFIQSSKTAHWPQRQIDLTNEEENRIVFDNFKEGDKGRSRKRICVCENKEDAAFIVKACNNYDSLLEALKLAANECKNDSFSSDIHMVIGVAIQKAEQ